MKKPIELRIAQEGLKRAKGKYREDPSGTSLSKLVNAYLDFCTEVFKWAKSSEASASAKRT